MTSRLASFSIPAVEHSAITAESEQFATEVINKMYTNLQQIIDGERNRNWTLCEGASNGIVVIPADTELKMTHTWGYNADNSMTKARDVTATLPHEMLLLDALQFIMDAYADTITYPRFYFVECVRVVGGVVEVHFGT